MQELVNVAVNNGLGICSFIALLYFIFTINKQSNETLNKINDSLIEIQVALVKLTERVSDIEQKVVVKNVKKKEE